MKALIRLALLLLVRFAAYNEFVAETEETEDYYNLLQISRDADEKAIKKAFRRLSIRFKPDKHVEDAESAAEQYRKIYIAFETLSDPEMRRLYDMLGERGVQKYRKSLECLNAQKFQFSFNSDSFDKQIQSNCHDDL